MNIEHNNVYELLQAIIAYGSLDIKTTMSIRLTSKSTCITDDVMDTVIANDQHNNVVWYARMLHGLHTYQPFDISFIRNVSQLIKDGDVKTINKVFECGEAVLFNTNAFERYVDTCFGFTKVGGSAQPSIHTIDTMIYRFVKRFIQKFRDWQEHASVRKLAVAYVNMVSLLSKVILWAIRCYDNVRSSGCELPLLHSKHFFCVCVGQFTRHRETCINIDQAMASHKRPHVALVPIIDEARKLCKAWVWSLSYGQPVFVGSKGGVYRVMSNTTGRKKYFKQ